MNGIMHEKAMINVHKCHDHAPTTTQQQDGMRKQSTSERHRNKTGCAFIQPARMNRQ